MRAVRYDAPRSWSVTDVPTPEPAAGEVLIRIGQAGVCGTDLHIHEGEFGAAFPLTPGHETVGTVAALGAGATRYRIGEQVTVNPNIPCGRCDYCRAGRPILCPAGRAHGVNLPGFFAEYAAVAETLVFSVDGLPPDTAVFTEPAACALHGVETLGIRPGASALVLGAGATGLLLAQLIAAGGASSVTVACPVPFQLDTATALSVDATVLIDRDDPEGNQVRLRDASPAGDGYDIVVEATGSAAVGGICVPLARRGGTVLVYGVTRAEDVIAFHPFDVFRREITIKGSFAEMTTFGGAIAALRNGRVRTTGIITHRFALDDFGPALHALRTDPTVHKIVIRP